MSDEENKKAELTKVETEQTTEISGGTEEVPTELSSPVSPKKSKKHPLQHAWTLWYDYPGRKNTASTYANFLQKVYTFQTV
jgi:translation initiation factor 4E